MQLLKDKAHDVSTIKYTLEKIKEAIFFLNPTQSPVVTLDQPLFALAKQIQWTWPNEFENFVFILGRLHIEITLLKVIGQILSNSGQLSAIEDSEVTSKGTAESMLNVNNINKTRRSLQITVCTLNKLLREAYETKMILEDKNIDFGLWCTEKKW